MSVPTILILGRPNVGKSSLFNLLNKKRKSIVHDIPGVTRDLLFSYCEWDRHPFILVDSGGVFLDGNTETLDEPFQRLIEDKVIGAAAACDLIFFMVDGRDGLQPYDQEIMSFLHPYIGKTLVVINKTDNQQQLHNNPEFFSLGISEYFSISVLQRSGIKDLMIEAFKRTGASPTNRRKNQSKDIKIAIVGKPNVGKSSLFNALANTEKALVSPVAGTTRDSLDHRLVADGQGFLFIDTAGLRKRTQMAKDDIDFFSYIRTIRAIEQCDVALLIVDATETISVQDKQIAAHIIDQGRACILVLNKWDLVAKDEWTLTETTKKIYRDLPFVEFAPVLFTSAMNKKRLHQVYQMITDVYNQYKRRITTGELNQFLKNLSHGSSFKTSLNHAGRIYYLTQADVSPPLFSLFINRRKYFPDTFLRFFEKQLRQVYGFNGTPLKIKLKEKTPPQKKGKKS